MESLYRIDFEVFRAIDLGWHNPYLNPLFFLFTSLGNGFVQVPLIILGRITREGRRLFWPMISAFLAGGLLGAQLLKHLIPRDRPSQFPFAHPQENIYYNSFPSGHTTAAMSISMVLLLGLWDTKSRWVGILAICLVPFVGLSRVYRGVHWPSDVIGGLFSGTLFGILTFLAFPSLRNRPSDSDAIHSQ